MADDPTGHIAQIRQSVAALEKQQESLGIDLSESIAPLRRLLAQLEQAAPAINTGSGSIAQRGGVAAGAGGVAVGGDVQGNIYIGPPPKDTAEALAIYRRVVAQTCGQLPLRGVDVGASDPTAGQKPLGLANVYVDLDTTAQVELKPDEKKKRERPSIGEHETRPLGALEAAIANRRIVLLGDPAARARSCGS